MDPDGWNQMMCHYVGGGGQSASEARDADGAPAPRGARDRSSATSPSPGPLWPASAVRQQPGFTGRPGEPGLGDSPEP